MTDIRFSIKRLMPSQNATMWKHWRAYSTERDIWYILIRGALTPKHPPEMRPMRLVITSYRVRTLDAGNLWGGSKPIPDGLKRLGYLKDDTPAWCSLHVEQFKVPQKEQRTEICLTPHDG